MSLPVNKKTLDTTIDTNIKANNPPNQSITAEVLHDTLIPIVNSTFGIKTIWGGYINASDDSGSGNNWVFKVAENYYDPNYFPALDPNTLTPADPSTLGQVGNRYRVTNFGSGLTDTPSVTVTTTEKTPIGSNSKSWRPVGGLTFDVKIVGGTLVGLKVNNPGYGYSWTQLYGSNTIVPQVIILNTGGTIQPEITIDLSRVISSPKKDSIERVPFNLSINGATATNVFPINYHILNAGTSVGAGTNIISHAIQYGVGGYESNFFQYKSAFPYQVFNYSTGSTQIAGTPGYWTAGNYLGSYFALDAYVEIKIPIINTTI